MFNTIFCAYMKQKVPNAECILLAIFVQVAKQVFSSTPYSVNMFQIVTLNTSKLVDGSGFPVSLVASQTQMFIWNKAKYNKP